MQADTVSQADRMRSETPAPPFRRMQLSGTPHPCQITAAIASPEGRIFFTVNLLERRSCLLVQHIDAFREAVRQVRARRPFHIDAWVVLPDHTHCIWTLPPGDTDYSARWKAIKIAFAKSLPKKPSVCRRYVYAKVNVAFGKGDFGNIPFVMSETMQRMSIMCISIRSSMDSCDR
ncbi:transposase [Undibacterium arcticum]